MASKMFKKAAAKIKSLFRRPKSIRTTTTTPTRKPSVYSVVKRSPTMSASPEAARYAAMSQGRTVRQVTEEDEAELPPLPRSESPVEIANVEEYLNKSIGTVVRKPERRSFNLGQLAAIRASSGSVQG